MFPQLDDPDGFAVSPDFRAAVRTRAGRLRRRRRALRVAAIGALPIIGVGAYGLVLRDRVDSVQQVHVSSAGPVGPDPLATNQPVTFLIIGTDAQAGAPYRAATAAEGRPDSIVLLRWVPAERSLSSLTLPRDLDLGEGKLDTRTVAQLPGDLERAFGMRVDHMVAIDMVGFAQLAGIVQPRVRVDQALRDRSSGLSLEPGCQTLSSDQTLAYVRSRHLQYQASDGSWVDDPTSDFGRSARLTVLAPAVLFGVHNMGIGDWNDALGVLADHAVLDDRLSVRELAEWTRSVDTSNGVTSSPSHLPVRLAPQSASGTSALHVDPDGVANALAPFGGHLDPTVPTDFQLSVATPFEAGGTGDVDQVAYPAGALNNC